jgi:hypothetical protein
MSVTMSLVSTTVTKSPFLKGAMEPFGLQKIQYSRLRPLLYLLGAKERRSCLRHTKEYVKKYAVFWGGDDISVHMSKTGEELLALLIQERHKSESTVGSRVASGSKRPASGLTADATPAGANGTAPVAAEGLQIPPSTGTEGRVNERLRGKKSATTTPENPWKGGQVEHQVDC